MQYSVFLIIPLLPTGARYVREVLPGEIIEMSRHGVRTVDVVERPADKQQAFCIFEYVYFARADSIFEGMVWKYFENVVLCVWYCGVRILPNDAKKRVSSTGQKSRV